MQGELVKMPLALGDYGNQISISISILASNDQKTNIMFAEHLEHLDAYLYIIIDLNIFFLTILCIFFRRNFKVLSYKVFLGETC